MQTKIDFNSINLDLFGCDSNFQQFNDEYVQAYGNPIYFLDRGNCPFTTKARNAAKYGKMLIIADNTNVTDIDQLVLSSNLSGKTFLSRRQ